MSTDYVSSNDEQFKLWLANFVTVLSAHTAEVGLAPDDLAPIEGVSAAFGAAVTAYQAAKNDLATKSSTKKDFRASAIAVLRPLVRRINNHPGMTNTLRSNLGLPERSDTVRTLATVGSEIPGIFVETAPGSVKVHFGTEPLNERINRKPSWAKGCNIYRKRTGDERYELIAFQSASPYIDRITGPGADYTYVVSYRGTKADEIGNESLEATIAARGAMAA